MGADDSIKLFYHYVDIVYGNGCRIVLTICFFSQLTNFLIGMSCKDRYDLIYEADIKMLRNDYRLAIYYFKFNIGFCGMKSR